MDLTMRLNPWLMAAGHDPEHPVAQRAVNVAFHERVDYDTAVIGPGSTITLSGSQWRDLGCPTVLTVTLQPAGNP